MQPTKPSLASAQVKLIFILLAIIVAILVALYLLVQNLALANTGVFSLYVPSRSTGDDFNLDSSQFTIMHAIAAGIAIYLTALSLWFVRQKQSKVATIMTISLVIYFSIYSALILGNVLNEEFGTLGTVIGVFVPLFAASIFSSYSILKVASKET